MIWIIVIFAAISWFMYFWVLPLAVARQDREMDLLWQGLETALYNYRMSIEKNEKIQSS